MVMHSILHLCLALPLARRGALFGLSAGASTLLTADGDTLVAPEVASNFAAGMVTVFYDATTGLPASTREAASTENGVAAGAETNRRFGSGYDATSKLVKLAQNEVFSALVP